MATKKDDNWFGGFLLWFIEGIEKTVDTSRWKRPKYKQHARDAQRTPRTVVIQGPDDIKLR